MHLRAAAAPIFLALSLAACSSAPPRPPRAPAPNDAIVEVECPVKDAEIWVDGRNFARVGDIAGGMALSPGEEHHIVIRHDDYHDRYFVLELEPKRRYPLEVRLAEILP